MFPACVGPVCDCLDRRKVLTQCVLPSPPTLERYLGVCGGRVVVFPARVGPVVDCLDRRGVLTHIVLPSPPTLEPSVVGVGESGGMGARVADGVRADENNRGRPCRVAKVVGRRGTWAEGGDVGRVGGRATRFIRSW